MNWIALIFSLLFGAAIVRAWTHAKDGFAPGAMWDGLQAFLCIAGWILAQGAN